jgi:ribonuclease D
MRKSSSPTNNIPADRAIWVDNPAQLKQLIKILLDESVVAVDTESDSLYSYFEKVCLIQFSTPKSDYLVDPLNVDVSDLGQFFANDSIQKIFHAAEYDLLSLKRDYGFSFDNLFDTMIAARILGWSRYGLAPLLKEYFDVKLDKRFQRYNWGQRPLNHKALHYARLDTHFLLPLRKIQFEQLEKENRLREATEAFERETQVEPTPKIFNAADFWRIKGAKELQPRQQAILRELFVLRDKIARKIDRPPFKVMNDFVLILLARKQPQGSSELEQVKGVGRNLMRYNSQDILKAISKGQTAPLPHYQPGNHHRPDEETMIRYETLRQWRNNLASERGVEPDVIMNNDTLMGIASHNPHSLTRLANIEILGDWQFETYGKQLIKVLKSMA